MKIAFRLATHMHLFTVFHAVFPRYTPTRLYVLDSQTGRLSLSDTKPSNLLSRLLSRYAGLLGQHTLASYMLARVHTNIKTVDWIAPPRCAAPAPSRSPLCALGAGARGGGNRASDHRHGMAMGGASAQGTLWKRMLPPGRDHELRCARHGNAAVRRRADLRRLVAWRGPARQPLHSPPHTVLCQSALALAHLLQLRRPLGH